ncbi:uncharacterized protein LOC116252276 isoform X2 [Nymphaea colorata]|uniref:uncharacterized protein LOC116252276 isoform X2 n=1 Tax=Nymphaea colorata TaxID=210225 RepID=UPI00214E2210|nr:uncharacterized protein LOC116252276 isoform X2 [Nymphaea colorata]
MTHRRFSLDRFPVSGNHKGGTCRRTGAFSGTQQISDRREAATAATLSWAAGHVMATSGLDGSWTSFKINMENFLLGEPGFLWFLLAAEKFELSAAREKATCLSTEASLKISIFL